MDIFKLFIAAWIPVIKMLLVAGVGSFLAAPFVGILNEDARKHLNNIVFYVCLPCLVENNLSQTFTLDSLVSAWFMPINILLTFIIGSSFGWILCKITKAPPQIRALLLGFCATGNLGLMLNIIIPDICKEKSSPFGAPDICYAKALAYGSLTWGVSDLLFWSYVYNVARIQLELGEQRMAAINHTTSIEDGISTNLDRSVAHGSISFAAEDTPENYRVIPAQPSTKTKDQAFKEIVKYLSEKSVVKAFRKMINPSIIGVIVGLTVGVVPPFRKAFIGDHAPLRAVQGAIKLLGDGAIPAITLIVGGNLAKGFRKSKIKVSYVVGVLIVRYFLLPLVGIGIVRGAIHFGILQRDPLYQFVLLVQFALPPALLIGVLAQQFAAGESECSIIFIWTYAFTLVIFPLWAAFFMWLVS